MYKVSQSCLLCFLCHPYIPHYNLINLLVAITLDHTWQSLYTQYCVMIASSHAHAEPTRTREHVESRGVASQCSVTPRAMPRSAIRDPLFSTPLYGTPGFPVTRLRCVLILRGREHFENAPSPAKLKRNVNA